MKPDQDDSSAPPYSAVLSLPFGGFGVRADDSAIRELVFLPPGAPTIAPDSLLAERATTQLLAWLDDPDRPFDLPLARRGTPFQQRVWSSIAAIPRGRLRTYGDIAGTLNSAARAVGQACGANPFPIVIPCHRVVAASGLGGFANSTGGYLLDAKRWLLAFEAAR